MYFKQSKKYFAYLCFFFFCLFGITVALATTPEGVDETADLTPHELELLYGREGLGAGSVYTPKVKTGQSVIALDPGHGQSDSGAPGFQGLLEKNLCLRIALACKDELQSQGYTVVMTRDSDKRIVDSNSASDLVARVNAAVAHNADVFVSFHLNSSNVASAHGVEVYYPNTAPYNYRECHVPGKVFAQNVLNTLTSQFGFRSRGIKTDNYDGRTYPAPGGPADAFSVIRNSRLQGLPAILIEHGFITNPSDATILNSKAEAIGKAEAHAIIASLHALPDDGLEQAGDRLKYKKPNNTYAKNEWIQVGDRWYYFDADNLSHIGWLNLGDTWYYMNDKGVMQIGWVKLGDNWYLLGQNGAMKTGWQSVDGSWYYMYPNGVMAHDCWLDKNWYVQSSGRAISADSGTWKKNSIGWWYQLADGSYPTSTAMKINGSVYVFDSRGYMGTHGWNKIGDTWYLLDASDHVMTGWQNVRNVWYYLGTDGKMVSNTVLEINGVKYAFTSSGAMAANGLVHLNGGVYCVDANGVFLTNSWKLIDNKWYYFNASGQAAVGWQYISNTWYYLDEAGVMAKGLKTINGGKYYLSDSGAMISNTWKLIGNDWYYFQDSGKACQSEWKLFNDTWYYFDSSAVMAKGLRVINNQKYFFLDSGAMIANRWQMINDYWYYFGGSGAMVTNAKISDTWSVDQYGRGYENGKKPPVDNNANDNTNNNTNNNNTNNSAGERGQSDASGSYFDSNQFVQIDPKTGEVISKEDPQPIMGVTKVSARQMADAFRKKKGDNAYPAIFAQKGAPTIDDFCSILYKVATAEGVRPEVLWSQIMYETGWLHFGGQVRADQCNFGGLGALDGTGSSHVATFDSVEDGLLAQTQHLKAYASTAALNLPCKDSRFRYVKRGSSPYVQTLGINENPLHIGWATTPNYGFTITAFMRQNFGL